jgi:quercetin dioxygenase-like cupin family protein
MSVPISDSCGDCMSVRYKHRMAIFRLYRGSDERSHFEDIQLRFEAAGDQSERAELVPGSGILVRRFEADRTNDWHHAPGRYAVFTLDGAVDIEIGDGTVRRLGAGDILLAEDLDGQGHVTREVGPEPRVSVFVPLPPQTGGPSSDR